MKSIVAIFLGFATCSVAVSNQEIFHVDKSQETWLSKYGKQDESVDFDIAVLGIPFDAGTTYRSGARFGPYAIRSGSRRQSRETRGYTLAWGINPYEHGSKVIDCGDVPVVQYDIGLAMDQIDVAYSTLLARPISSKTSAWKPGALLAKDGREHPRIVSMGGDHTIALPILRALNKTYGPISVIHFDAHLDTWRGGIGHGTFLSVASKEGLISNNSIHAGIRCKIAGWEDIENDHAVGFHIITSDAIDDYGVPAIIKKIRERVGDSPVYLSFDIDVIDAGLAPGRTPEAGGWTTREVKRIIRGLSGLNFVGADLVEVAPAYDHAEVTGTTAADIVHDLLTLLVSEGPLKPPMLPGGWPRDEL